MNRLVGDLTPRPYLLKNSIQPYAWGERGPGAFIPRLLDLPTLPGQPYAELWVGAHPNAPSLVRTEAGWVPLPELVQVDPNEILGSAAERFDGQFPFLLKILSAAEPLSIQAHPDRALARLLRQRDPAHYPDANHKPELVYVLDALDVLCGFRPWAQIRTRLQRTPELAQAAGWSVLEADRAGLEAFYRQMVQTAISQPERLAQAAQALSCRLQAMPQEALDSEETLFLELCLRYPGDIGLFSLFLLDRRQLPAGGTLFTGPGLPHAYLRGNIIEVMANSDNVVRAGLTSKFTDLPALLEVVDVHAAPLFPQPRPGPWGAWEIPCPAEEFQLYRWELQAGEAQAIHYGPRALVLLSAQGKFTLRWPGGSLTCLPGGAALAPASLGEVQMVAASACQVFGVTSPL